ncbi:hypothetical protein N7539_008236 [Penicillium diatomitis]|uniref:Uncharacterized protein n=1 Tax=Penicillium diatomitis TaxID=2819901 RepID=A0A9W9WTD9_9EURO|nr:uncharacterized protein N7539_008236 [Penicillium diatomitis]KAJ5475170.1 hypothetical protein N7539_008236 [Penicillium diatomitis]
MPLWKGRSHAQDDPARNDAMVNVLEKRYDAESYPKFRSMRNAMPRPPEARAYSTSNLGSLMTARFQFSTVGGKRVRIPEEWKTATVSVRNCSRRGHHELLLGPADAVVRIFGVRVSVMWRLASDLSTLEL